MTDELRELLMAYKEMDNSYNEISEETVRISERMQRAYDNGDHALYDALREPLTRLQEFQRRFYAARERYYKKILDTETGERKK